tara:strand:- start:781 stop:1215 length:435 start_codon:yes stop_codon:yes gene_type:complete
MEVNKEEIIDPKGNQPLPRPIAERKCKCSCGHYFYPSRRDQVYLNKQHADFGYNHGKRKSKNKNKVNTEKILLKNDNILSRHFNAEKDSTTVDRYLDILVADGFIRDYNIGKHEENSVDYYYTYNFYYRILLVNNIKKVKIYKR